MQRTCGTPSRSSGSEQGTDLAAEGLDLVDQLVDVAAGETHLQMVDADLRPRAQRVGDLLGRPADALPVDVPGRLPDVEPLGDGADVAGLPVARSALAFAPVEVDEVRHLVERRALREPPVGEACGAADRRGCGAADPERRSRRLHWPR